MADMSSTIRRRWTCYVRVCDLGQWAERGLGSPAALIALPVPPVLVLLTLFKASRHPRSRFEFVTPPPTTFTNLILLPVSAPRIQCRFVEPNRWTIAANQFGYASATLVPQPVSRYSLVVFTRMWTRHLFYQLDGWTTTFQETTFYQFCNIALLVKFTELFILNSNTKKMGYVK